MIELVYAAAIGLLVGLVFQQISVSQVRKRSDNEQAIKRINSPIVIILRMVLSAALFAGAFWRYDDTVERIQALVIISIAINITAVDVDIRKIPNESVLLLFLTKVGVIIAQLVQGQQFREVTFPAVMGLVVGFALYCIPSVFKIPIGAGDIKFCAAIGFCLGVYGFLESSIIMALAMLVFWAYLKISKRGSMRTVTMMGPYLSLGAVFSLLLPYTEIIKLFS